MNSIYIDAEMAGSQWDSSCFIGVTQLDLVKRLVVDLRDEAAFNRHHIPGALNMPAHLVKRKPFLQGRSVLLVDDGYRHKQSQVLCLALREDGVDAVVLQGGLRRWHDQGNALTGSADALAALSQVSAKVLVTSFNFNAWVLVDMTVSGMFANEVLVVDGLLRREAVFHRPYDVGGVHFVTQLQQLVQSLQAQQQGSASSLTLVLADEMGHRYSEIDKALSALSPDVDVLFVSGGMAALTEYSRTHALMWAQLKLPPKSPSCGR